MAKVIVGMSGGVDSAVAAYLLKQAGHDVVGVTLRTWVGDNGEDSRCCEIDDARETARTIGIPYYVFNCISDFEEKIVRPFSDCYIRGLTPNPCVICNREIKWARLLYYAELLQADFVATGHYACTVKLQNGRYTVKKALHAEKDQTYMLYRLSQSQLEKTLMPLGGYSKSEVRAIAEAAGIRVASKPDSQEICFVTDGDYADFIASHTDAALPGEGNFVDESGNILGRHKGIVHYTVGQRKGLGIALGRPAYIKKICADNNEIVLGTSDDVRCTELICGDLCFMSVPEPRTGEKLRCLVKVRYRHPGQYATLEKKEDGRLLISFDEPVRSAAPGQSAVFYDGDGCVVGGGIISDVVFGGGR
ncbi:MAG: tRNA 2-thiouridine(34) synthase MnmA [Clostridia bacterium]|nr:tRNA 2-thiouridine(34) synthase MnmA [Clostridia bacterium]